MYPCSLSIMMCRAAALLVTGLQFNFVLFLFSVHYMYTLRSFKGEMRSRKIGRQSVFD